MAALPSYLAQDLTYGTKVSKILLKDYSGREFFLPVDNSITVVYFFNIKNPVHLNILLELNYLGENLNYQKPIVSIVGISKANHKDFDDILNKFKLRFFLVNDNKNDLSKQFQAGCENCLKIIVIDKSSRIRYLSSQFDSTFLREIIQRYASEEL